MKIELRKMELFANLAQFDHESGYFDLHNDFSFRKLMLAQKELVFSFSRDSDEKLVTLAFQNAEIIRLTCSGRENRESLVLDTLYRGRFETDPGLSELSDNGKAIIYFDFIDGLNGEFLSDTVVITA